MKYLKLFEDYSKDEWFGDSKVVDSEGNPLVLYHGTNVEFDSFDEEYQLNGWMGKGFYFTDNLEIAKSYGKYVKKVILRIVNPFIVEGNSPSDNQYEIDKMYNPNKEIFYNDLSEILKSNSHDGVFFTHWEQGNMYSCFYANQIKIVG